MSGATPTSTKALAEAKAKKQKKILAILSMVFLVVVGFQMPRLMGGGGSAQSAGPPTTAAATDAVAGSPLAAAPPTGSLPDTDRVVVVPGTGQLISFGLFKSKDPFVQQLSANQSAISPTPIAAPPVPNATAPLTTTSAQPHVPPRSSAPNGGLTPVTTTPILTTPSVVSPSTTPISPSATKPASPTATSPTVAPAAAPTSVSISTNGTCEVVSVNGTFPADEDIFKVVSIAKNGKSAKISVVGGAYDSGAASVTLELGKKITLVNTADGTRYVLLLRAKCDVETSPVTGGTGGTTTSTTPTSAVAPPTPTSTVTTPIVTDSLDTTTPR